VVNSQWEGRETVFTLNANRMFVTFEINVFREGRMLKRMENYIPTEESDDIKYNR
jgi:hypothetical protein